LRKACIDELQLLSNVVADLMKKAPCAEATRAMYGEFRAFVEALPTGRAKDAVTVTRFVDNVCKLLASKVLVISWVVFRYPLQKHRRPLMMPVVKIKL